GAEAFDLIVETDGQPSESPAPAPGPVELAIGQHIAGLVEDGATLQLGIGAVPDAVLAALAGHKHLGLHSGAVGDGIVELQRCGALTNSRKEVDAGTSVTGHLLGSRLLRDWAHGQPSLRLRATSYTHDPA